MKFKSLCLIAVLLSSCAKSNIQPISKTSEHDSSKIQWQNWSEENFTKAKKEKKYVIMDLEAVWCHWCHVMEEKTYSNSEIISLIQTKFIPVRVDQDSRPDLSNRYGDYGWPATIVFDGDGKEITKQQGYLPPDEMKSLLELIVKNPHDPSLLDKVKTEISESTSEFLTVKLKQELEKIQKSFYDPKQGAWGFRHKYLEGRSLEYVIARSSKDAEAKKMAIQTLDNLINIVDPVWGGLYQYSTHGDWNHPHFEKIMSMQTQAIQLYARGYTAFKKDNYALTAQKIYEYMKVFLTSAEGAFYTSQDADVVPGEHAGEYFDLNDDQRRKKGIPRVDQNIYARENGWAIESFAVMYGTNGDLVKLEDAIVAAKWMTEHRGLKSGGFRHDLRDEGSYLGDSLAMAKALLQLYIHTGDRQWLKRSEQAANYINQSFQIPDTKRGGFVTSKNKIANQTAMPDRDENIEMARFANLLFRYTGNSKYQEMAKLSMRYLLIPEIAKKFLTAGILLADDEISQDPIHITIVGSKSDAYARVLFQTALAHPVIYKRIEWKDPKEGPLPNPDVDYPELDKPAAFICTQRLCSSPIFDANDLKKRMENML